MKGKKTHAKKRLRRRRKTIAKMIEERGSTAQFARDLSKLSGQEITWSRVNNWKIRDAVSKNMVVYVHRLTGTPLIDLLRAPTEHR